MSKASTTSIQHLLRQLYLAKPASIEGAAAVISGGISSSSSNGSGRNGGGIAASSLSSSSSSSFSTAAATRSLHGDIAPSSSSSSHPPLSSSSSPSTSTSTGEWTTTATTPTSSSSSSNNNNSHTKTTGSNARNHAHHYHRHHGNAAHHHHHVPVSSSSPSSTSSSLLPSSFWIQSNPSSVSSSGASTPTSSSSHPSASSSSSSSPSSSVSPPLPPFSNASTSFTNAPLANYTYSPATSSSSNATSSSSSIASTSSTSQLSNHHYTSSSTTNGSSSSHSLNDQQSQPQSQHQEQDNKLSSSNSNLTLLPGAYGIPKRMSSAAPGNTSSSSSSAKGKGKEVSSSNDEANDALQEQIAQLRENMLSVQVGEDAYFVRHDALGVADGVGGWSGRRGADPGLFAARLMHHCSAELELAERLSEKLARKSSSSRSSGLGNDSEELISQKGNSNEKGEPKLAFVSSATSTLSRSMEGQNDGGHEQATMKIGMMETSMKVDKKKIDMLPEHHNNNTTNDATLSTSIESITTPDPIEILHRAWDQTLTEFSELNLIGSCTALIVLLNSNKNELNLINIGDCCLSIIRDGKYIFRLQEQQHSFNYPFQIGTNSKDTPRKDSQIFNIKIEKNDLIILSSDGLVDNLFDEDILEEVERYSISSSSTTTSSSSASSRSENEEEVSSMNEDNTNGTSSSTTTSSSNVNTISPERLSKALCSRAKAVSEDQRAVTSPFQQRANEEGIHFVGGKHDDITVLVAVIGDKSEGD